MSLYKRGNVYWASFYVRGVRHQISTGATCRRNAETIETRLREEANLRSLQMRNYEPQLLFREIAQRFVAKGTVRAHHASRLKLLLPFFGETPIGLIDRGTVARYRKQRHEQKIITEATINRDVEVLRHILYWAVDDAHVLPANPIARIRLERERKKRRPILAVADEIKLLTAASPQVRLMAIAALDTGMRRGELLNQRWQDVDWHRRIIVVTRSKTAEGECREIPMTNRLCRLLWRTRQEEGLIFLSDICQFRRSWKRVSTDAGLNMFRFHDLRHTFNTRLMEAGVMREIRKALMGHSGGEDVHDIYTHVELPLKRKAIQELEQWRESQFQRLQSRSPAA